MMSSNTNRQPKPADGRGGLAGDDGKLDLHIYDTTPPAEVQPPFDTCQADAGPLAWCVTDSCFTLAKTLIERNIIADTPDLWTAVHDAVELMRDDATYMPGDLDRLRRWSGVSDG